MSAIHWFGVLVLLLALAAAPAAVAIVSETSCGTLPLRALSADSVGAKAKEAMT